MSIRIAMNKKVTITAVYFRQARELRYFPKRMELEGREYHFKDGLSYSFKRGDKSGSIYDMHDGEGGHYRLLFDAVASSWTLMRITRTV